MTERIEIELQFDGDAVLISNPVITLLTGHKIEKNRTLKSSNVQLFLVKTVKILHLIQFCI